MGVFSRCIIAISGSFGKGKKQTDIENWITKNGGSISKSVGPETTHLITNEADVTKKGTKIRAALESKGAVKIVSIEWLEESLSKKKRLDEKEFTVSGAEIVDDGDDSQNASRRVTRGKGKKDTAKESDSQNSAVVAPVAVAGKKRGRSRKVNGEKQDADGDTAMEDADKQGLKEKEEEKEEEKPAKRSRGKKAASVTTVPTNAATTTAKRGRGKAAAKEDAIPPVAAADDQDEDNKEEEDQKKQKSPTPEPPKKMKTVVMAKGTAPVDDYVPNSQAYNVYIDGDGVHYDGSLNQTDVRANANKFYYVQLLCAPSGYATWTRWGRVGEKGQSAWAAMPGSSFHVALGAFEKKFKDKTGLTWWKRFDAPKSGKYTFIERTYGDSDDEDDEDKASESKKGKKKEQNEEDEIPPSKLLPQLQSLMALIFNQNHMASQMQSMSYDSNKLPLGKLSKNTLKQGYSALKEIGDLLNTLPSSAPGCTVPSGILGQLETLTNKYYSVIPHSFGRNVPPIIRDTQRLKKEVELVESLGDMEIATEIMKASKGPTDKDGNPIHPTDAQFNSLNLEEATPLDKTSTEFLKLQDYLAKTHGKTHYITLEIEDIFRIERQGEFKRFEDSGYDKFDSDKDDRYLLWHGSRSTNFAGILSQGLRIAPPEAPVNGYMFGKGIYLADMVTKSANYCCAEISGNTGLLLLCEAQLGKPMYECIHADFYADQSSKKNGALCTKGVGRAYPTKWMDAGTVHENLKGVQIPDVEIGQDELIGDSSRDGRYLQYNEYIVYDVSQVKLRYLFKCKFKRR